MSELQDMLDETSSDHREEEVSDVQSCPVCMERRPTREMCFLRCRHMICARCMPQLQIGRCPICRSTIYPVDQEQDRDDTSLGIGTTTANILGIVGERISLTQPNPASHAGQGENTHQDPESSVDDLLRFSLQEFMDHVRNDTGSGAAPLIDTAFPGTISAARPSIGVEVPSLRSAPSAASPGPHAHRHRISSQNETVTSPTRTDDLSDGSRDDLAMVILCRSGSLRNTLESLRTLFVRSSST